ncbi:MAG: Putative baseplate assembly protein [uncultured Thiotrichaceae bacterium]|uniref:Baseplate assembly protein n=1 Tax=uncultured Thiotrichaceae bacterium TaxID=298394 RepID=A0A6S6SDG0_9GAMM|nr:MAG: Putative baseplate assembly protein [uncultured Thiotrichaceae bacterium]
MPIPSPNLDDRTFQQLVDEAVQYIQANCPEWNNFNPADPGMTLVELFAFLTENMLYRVNRLPEKTYVEFLKLLGTELKPPAAARVKLRFTRHNEDDLPVDIPQGTRVTIESTGDEAPPIFTLEQAIHLQSGKKDIEGYATQGKWIEAELAGLSNGMAGFSTHAQHIPIPSPTLIQQDIKIGIETPENELEADASVISYRGKSYHLWEVVDNFFNTEGKPYVCMLDRLNGTISFAPSVQLLQEDGALSEIPQTLAAIPPLGREIRLWYFSGGNVKGNVAANTLTILKDPIAGITVTNPEAASGGRNQETLDNAIRRGPFELHALNRAVTARDFQQIALNSSRQVERAIAVTSADLWQHAIPGTVEVILVPYLPRDKHNVQLITREQMHKQQTTTAIDSVQQTLDIRRPMGTACKVSWAQYKTIRVEARLIAQEYENIESAQKRIEQRLYERISPVPQGDNKSGLPFGKSLHISQIYDVLLADPGIRWVDHVQLVVDEVPVNQSTELAADRFQKNTWFTNRHDKLFRTMDNGEGWEQIAHFQGETVTAIFPHTEKPGLIAVITNLIEQDSSRIHFSDDCGESWDSYIQNITMQFKINDATWIMRGKQAVLLLATNKGLYELEYMHNTSPVPLAVSHLPSDQGYYAIASSPDVRGKVFIAVAAKSQKGVYLSDQGGAKNSFSSVGLTNKDIRVLIIHHENARTFLWAGAYSAGGHDEGTGCSRLELHPEEMTSIHWQDYTNQWKGGSCYDLHISGAVAYAATHRAGVLKLNTNTQTPVWTGSTVNNGLPMRDMGRFHIINAIATSPDNPDCVLVATQEKGIYRSEDAAKRFTNTSKQTFVDKVTLPSTWLLCSGHHHIEIKREHES